MGNLGVKFAESAPGALKPLTKRRTALDWQKQSKARIERALCKKNRIGPENALVFTDFQRMSSTWTYCRQTGRLRTCRPIPVDFALLARGQMAPYSKPQFQSN